MSRKLPIFYSALLLTFVNLLLRFAGTGFQVYLSGRVGAAGIGLLQLVMSVGNLAMVAGIGGIRTATIYLTAEEIGKKRTGNVRWILSGCILYSIIFSATVSVLLYRLAPRIALTWIGDTGTADALRLFAAYLPVSCLCGVMTGYFTAANRIGTLVAVEVAEQLVSMTLTLIALHFFAGNDPCRACVCVILGSCAGSVLTLCCLILLRQRENAPAGSRIPTRSRLLHTALPLALADDLKSGISTLENLMVPKRLMLHPGTDNALAAFGMISGMVFPVIMFPAAILFALAELMIPELARCAAAGSQKRIHYLVRKCLRIGLVYGIYFGGCIYLLSDWLCIRLYQSNEAARYMQLYGLLIPMLYCDAITDAMIKGLGQQTACVRYNILTSTLDVILLYFLLPIYGMSGYYFSFLITHLINFSLSLNRLLKITIRKIPFYIPAFSVSCVFFSVWAASFVANTPLRCLCFGILLSCLLFLFRVLRFSDVLWLKDLIYNKASHL